MKRLFTMLLLVLSISVVASADNFTTSTTEKSVYTDTTTTHTYEIKNVKYDIFKSKSGAYYIWKTSSKTNKKYKYYLPKEIQIKLGRKYNDK